MVTELALLSLHRGQGLALEAAFAAVAPLLAGAQGYIRHRLMAALDQPDCYVLAVEWQTLADHVAVFEPSAAHARFMAALEPFLAGDPLVIHLPGTPSVSGVDAPDTTASKA